MMFWDTSALAMTALLTKDPDIVVWALTPVELTSTLTRRTAGEPVARRDIDALIAALESTWQTVDSLIAVADRARVLLRAHPLRAADALQLAAAFVAAVGDATELPFVTLDYRLAEAPSAENGEAFRRLVRLEQELFGLLQQKIEQDAKMLGE